MFLLQLTNLCHWNFRKRNIGMRVYVCNNMAKKNRKTNKETRKSNELR